MENSKNENIGKSHEDGVNRTQFMFDDMLIDYDIELGDISNISSIPEKTDKIKILRKSNSSSFVENILNPINRGILVYMIINTIITIVIFNMFFVKGNGILYGIIAYLATLFIAVSPVGEAIFRFQNGCKKISNYKNNKHIIDLFDQVYRNVKLHIPELQDGIKLYIHKDESYNAFAIGRHTICVTTGLLKLSDEEIKAVLAHEFGHIVNQDTDIFSIVVAGNIFVTIFFMIGYFVAWFIGIAASRNDKSGIVYRLLHGVVGLTHYLWSMFGLLFISHSSRKKEYRADRFAAEVGYSDGLISFFNKIGPDGSEGIWKALISSHPSNLDRMKELSKL